MIEISIIRSCEHNCIKLKPTRATGRKFKSVAGGIDELLIWSFACSKVAQHTYYIASWLSQDVLKISHFKWHLIISTFVDTFPRHIPPSGDIVILFRWLVSGTKRWYQSVSGKRFPLSPSCLPNESESYLALVESPRLLVARTCTAPRLTPCRLPDFEVRSGGPFELRRRGRGWVKNIVCHYQPDRKAKRNSRPDSLSPSSSADDFYTHAAASMSFQQLSRSAMRIALSRLSSCPMTICNIRSPLEDAPRQYANHR